MICNVINTLITLLDINFELGYIHMDFKRQKIRGWVPLRKFCVIQSVVKDYDKQNTELQKQNKDS